MRNLVKKEVDNLKRRKEELENKIEMMKTPLGAEKELRSKFQVAKPGEEYVVIVEQEATSNKSSLGAKEKPIEKFFNFFKNIFKGI